MPNYSRDQSTSPLSPSESPLERSRSYHNLLEIFSLSQTTSEDEMSQEESLVSLASLGSEILSQEPTSGTESLSQEMLPPRKRQRLERLDNDPKGDRLVSMLLNPQQPLRENSQPLLLDLSQNVPRKRSVRSKSVTFRFRATSLFCTWPQCATPKEDVLANILLKWPEAVLFAVVAQEKHADGNLHLHALIKFKTQISASDARFADDLSGSHGKYESAKSIKKVLKYVMKDGCYVVHGDVPSIDAKKKSDTPSVFDEICEKLDAGASLPQIRAEYPKTYLLHKNRISDYYADCRLIRELKSILPWPGIDPSPFAGDGPEADWRLYAMNCWFRDNLYTEEPRPLKTPQLYIYGPTDLGKTTMIATLSKFVPIYPVPMQENWYNGFDEDYHRLMVFEEWKGQKPMTYMNMILDGQPTFLPQKNSMYRKTINTPIVLLSNVSPEDSYRNVYDKDPSALEPFVGRFLVLDFSNYDCGKGADKFHLRINFKESVEA